MDNGHKVSLRIGNSMRIGITRQLAATILRDARRRRGCGWKVGKWTSYFGTYGAEEFTMAISIWDNEGNFILMERRPTYAEDYRITKDWY